jgi:hypothetical protein
VVLVVEVVSPGSETTDRRRKSVEVEGLSWATVPISDLED